MAGKRLCVEEGELIDDRLRQGWSFADIATELGRSPSTVLREVNANGGRDGYVAGRAQRAASERARRPKHPVLAADAELAGVVLDRLQAGWGPAAIAAWLAAPAA